VKKALRINNRNVIQSLVVKDYNTNEIICQADGMMIDSSVMQNKPRRGWFLCLAGAVIAAAMFKIWLLAAAMVPFNSDEAIVALMAKHILHGERPIFFYGQAYMGSLDAYLIAAVFKIIGEQVWGIRIVQIVLYSLAIITTAVLGVQLTGKWKVGVLAAWFLAVPTINTTLYTTVSLGGYGEMLVIGNLILLTTLWIVRSFSTSRKKVSIVPWFALGFLCGFGLWIFGLTLVYAIPAFIYLAWFLNRSKQNRLRRLTSKSISSLAADSRDTKQKFVPVNQTMIWSIAFVGFAFGALPWWAYAQNTGVVNLLHELGGGAISGVESLNLMGQIFRHLLNLILFGSTVILGLRPPWEIRWLALPLAPIVLIFWGGVIVYAIKKTRKDLNTEPIDNYYSHSPLLIGVIIMLIVGFILLPFGADPSGRYFLPFGVILALFASQAIWKWYETWGKYVWILVGLIMLFNIWGAFQVVQASPPGATTQFDAVTQIDHSYDQELIDFLVDQGENWGYTNYWVSYPIAFLSDERLIFVPRLPYHQDLRFTLRDDRYEPYDKIVRQSERVAYVTTNNPNLDEQLRLRFASKGISWRESRIGDYLVYYQLSRKIHPDEIGLGGSKG
jgi:hypothetical protein